MGNLKYQGAYVVKKSTVSDSTKATVSATNKAINGVQSLEISNLAQTAYLTGDLLGEDVKEGTTLAELGVSGPETITVTKGTGANAKTEQIEVTADMTVKDLTQKLSSSGLKVNFDTDNRRIFIGSDKSGKDNDFTISDSPFMTTVEPTSNDGFFYIPIGTMTSATVGYFNSSNRIHAYVDNAFQPVDVSSQIIAINAKQQASNANTSITELGLYVNGGSATEVSTVGYPSSNVEVNTSMFYEKVNGQYGDYTFTYNGSAWKLNGTTVDLEEYGITLESTPAANNKITVSLTRVVGTIEDIDNRFDTLSNLVDSNAATAASDLASATSDINASLDETNENITSIVNELSIINSRTQSMGFNELYGLILYAIGATDATGFKLQLSPNAINFINGQLGNSSDVLASMSGSSLKINNAVVNQRLRFGNFAFIPRSNGNMCLKYLG